MERIIQTTWEQERHHFPQGPIISIFNSLDPKDTPPILKVRYFYGESILENGQFLLPDNLSKELHHLNYSTIPLIIPIEKQVELYIQSEQRVTPLALCLPGSLLGLYEVADYLVGEKSLTRWHLMAGARTIFTLPKLTDKQGCQRLEKQYGLHIDTHHPKEEIHQNHLFSMINKQLPKSQRWFIDLLVFPESWFKKARSHHLWDTFYQKLFEAAWKSTNTAMVKMNLDLQWNAISDLINKIRLKPRLNVVDTLKHLAGIAQGYFPGLQPATTEDAAPIQAIQEALLEVYQVRSYWPTLMQVAPFEYNTPTYYSLHYPTLISGHPYNHSASSIMSEIKSIKYLIEKIQHAPTTQEFFGKIKFDFFHGIDDISNDINSSKALPSFDGSFSPPESSRRLFCHSSPFFKGCISLQDNNT